MFRMRIVFTVLFGLFSFLILISQNTKEEELRLLFIGNSLTYQNNLPMLVLHEGQSDQLAIYVDMIAEPNYALIDHWNNLLIQKAIEKEAYDYVIVQQGPSSQAYGRQILIDYGGKINDLCTKYGSKMIFFMVWPARTYYHTFDQVIVNHFEAGSETGALVCPVGLKWKKALEENIELGLYGQDDFHPSLKGSLFAAKELYKCLRADM